jgi:hypothetical protein
VSCPLRTAVALALIRAAAKLCILARKIASWLVDATVVVTA